MAGKSLKLLLVENVDNLGIVGDVVSVRTGYARNFLLPRGLATKPSEDLVRSLAAKRAEAEKLIAQQRAQREALIKSLEGFEMTMQRSCNEQGILYGAVTQQDIASAMRALGHAVSPRDVRLPVAIKRVDHYDVQIKFATDLATNVKVHVVADRQIQAGEERQEMEFDNEGNLIVATPGQPGEGQGAGGDRRERRERRERGDRGGDRGRPREAAPDKRAVASGAASSSARSEGPGREAPKPEAAKPSDGAKAAKAKKAK